MGNDELKILIAAELKKSTEQDINRQLKELKLDTLKLNVDINGSTTTIKNEVQKTISQVNQQVSSGIGKVEIPLSFDKDNMQNLKRELQQFANEIAKLQGYKEAKVTTNYKRSYDEFGNLSDRKLSTASIDYYNESNEKALTTTYKLISGTDELGNEFQKLALTSEKASDDLRKQAETYTMVAAKVEKLQAKISTLKTSYNSMLDVKLDDGSTLNGKLGIVESGLLSATNLEDIKVLETRFDSATEAARNLDAMMVKAQPSKAIEKLPQELTSVKNELDKLLISFRNLNDIPLDKVDEIEKLQAKLANVTSQEGDYSTAEGQLKGFKEIKLASIDLGEKLDVLKEKQKGVNAEISKISKMGNIKSILSSVENKLSVLPNAELKLPDGSGTKSLNDSLEKLKQRLVEIGNEKSFDKQSKMIDDLNVDVKELSKNITLYNQQASNLRLESGFDSKLENTITKHQKTLSQYSAMGSNKQLMEEYNAIGAKLSELKAKAETFRQAGIFDKSLVSELSSVQAQMTGLNSKIVIAGKNTKSFKDIMSNAVKKFTEWGLASSVVMQIKAVVNNVVELDGALVDLQMATGGTRPQTQELLNTYIDLGKEIGATTTEVAASANDWLRQGKTVAETNTLIRDSMILSKIGNIDAAKSTEYLTTARNGYNVSVEKTIGIVDKLSAVDMISATSAGGLAEGMSEVATNANLAGVSMDKLLGYLAVIGETTGESMSSVGNGLSTMFSRMGNIKLSRLKDYQNGGEDLSNVETVLRGLGVSLRDSDKEFRNFGETLDEVGGNWGTYDDVTQRAIASSIAGKDHMEQFLVLMGHYSKATEYATVATDSAGTALEKMDNYEQGIEKSQKALTASFEGFSNAVLNSGLTKGTFDAGSGILGFFTELIDTLGDLPTLITVAAGAMSGFKNVGISNVKYAPPYPRGMAA